MLSAVIMPYLSGWLGVIRSMYNQSAKHFKTTLPAAAAYSIIQYMPLIRIGSRYTTQLVGLCSGRCRTELYGIRELHWAARWGHVRAVAGLGAVRSGRCGTGSGTRSTAAVAKYPCEPCEPPGRAVRTFTAAAGPRSRNVDRTRTALQQARFAVAFCNDSRTGTLQGRFSDASDVNNLI